MTRLTIAAALIVLAATTASGDVPHVTIDTGGPAEGTVTLELDGTPVDTRYPIGEPRDGNIGVMISLGTGGGLLAATGGRLVFDSPERDYAERYLAVSDPAGEGFTRILERRTPLDQTGRQ